MPPGYEFPGSAAPGVRLRIAGLGRLFKGTLGEISGPKLDGAATLARSAGQEGLNLP